MSSGVSSGASVPNEVLGEDSMFADASDDSLAQDSGEEGDKPTAEDKMHEVAEDLSKGVLEATQNLNASLRQASNGSDVDENENFTWEHFFTKHCGILPEDALRYETALIAHRMDPLDTFLESFGLIIEYGRIPIGDKLKITKTIEKREKQLEDQEKAMDNARKVLGLEKFNSFQAQVIMDLAGCNTEYHIDYGIERFEDGMREIERTTSIAMLKDPKAAEMYNAGAAAAKLMKDPTFQFLSSFGYKTFEYTKGKLVAEPSVHNRSASNDSVVKDILLGNMNDPNLNNNVPDNMYS